MLPFFIADVLGDGMGQARRAVVLDLWRLIQMAQLSNEAGFSNDK